MNIIEKKIQKLENLKTVLIEIVRREVVSEREWISERIRRQLREGKKGDGSDMPEYVQNSKQPSAPGKINLFDSGEFHAGIEPLFEDDHFKVAGLDSKTDLLVGKYGAILHLSQQNIEELRKRIRGRVIQSVLNHIM